MDMSESSIFSFSNNLLHYLLNNDVRRHCHQFPQFKITVTESVMISMCNIH